MTWTSSCLRSTLPDCWPRADHGSQRRRLNMRAQVEASSPAAKAALEDFSPVARSYGVERESPPLVERTRRPDVGARRCRWTGDVDPSSRGAARADGRRRMGGLGSRSVGRPPQRRCNDRPTRVGGCAGRRSTTRPTRSSGLRSACRRSRCSTFPDALAAIRTLRPGFAAQRVSVADRVRVRRESFAGRSGPPRNVANEGRFLIPVIDLINHHERGAPWRSVDSSLSISVARPAGDSQCFVRYRARQDPLDLALGYGFVDNSCTWLGRFP